MATALFALSIRRSVFQRRTESKRFLNIVKGPGKMSQWQAEKEKYLSMNLDEKRKQYATSKYFTTNDVPTWKEYVKKHEKLAEKIPLLPENKINPALNAQLADKISIFRGDITSLEIDVIVNAANKSLKGGGGVDGAIHKAASHELLVQECMTYKGCPVGEAKLTGGYKLPAKFIIHTVGPQGEKPELLKNCYKNCLDIMLGKKFRTIAFPCISTGIYGYPVEPAAHIAAMEVRKQLEAHPTDIDRVIFCLFMPADEQTYQGILQSYFPVK